MSSQSSTVNKQNLVLEVCSELEAQFYRNVTDYHKRNTPIGAQHIPAVE